ncbi:vWA domain-containing protein [Parablautia sp. Marseille-Q6255]|uniref:vWA domain-containing protein n=1 Tax=Parablautia sp. Marseille-Q6255 TaxID=3039593 RepID=UPI0024BD1E20|nr:VWA-like domain-containing protein [Parablautia sp. Marseille-Q6255]
MNPVYEEQKQMLDFIEVAGDILRNARNELYLNMRFLDVALSSLAYLPDQQIRMTGTNGSILYYQPDALVALFRKGRACVNRQYLHSIVHCLFSHLWERKDRDVRYWNLACDIAAEYVIDGLYQKAVHLPKSSLRREVYRMLSQEGEQKTAAFVVTAQRVYRFLCRLHPVQAQLEAWEREFLVDDHSRWEQDPRDQKSPSPQQRRWEDIRDRMQTEMETFAKEASDDVRSLEEQICAVNRKRYDYREFLRKFSVLKEEMQVDMDSFDYIFYNYGMELYGNMPLIEPLETKEVQRVEDFVIVLDTSMSCKGELIRHFLEETYSVLSESEGFARKIHVHILQCDDQVQEDVLVTSREEMREYLEHFTVRGFGGTDFRPAFARVQELLERKCFTKLRGLIYFTDGYGTFPVRKPPYETAFVFMKEDYRDVDVPPWAIRLIIDPQEFREADTKS